MLLGQMCGASEKCADKLMENNVLPLVDTALKSDPNFNEVFYLDVLRAAECLLHILQAGKGKYIPAVRLVSSISKGIIYFHEIEPKLLISRRFMHFLSSSILISMFTLADIKYNCFLRFGKAISDASQRCQIQLATTRRTQDDC